jgi:glycosyltransferase involved in cell wall biosynthesis
MPEKPHGSILRRAGPLMLARLGVAAFSFAIPLVLARLLLPESYGTFKQAWLLSNTLVLVLPLGLNQSRVYFVPREPAKKRLWQSHALVLTTAPGALAAGLLLGFGPRVRATIEAMAAGVPVASPSRELVGVDLATPRMGSVALADRLLALLKDHKLGPALRRRAEEEFSLDAFRTRLGALYDAILAPDAPRLELTLRVDRATSLRRRGLPRAARRTGTGH